MSHTQRDFKWQQHTIHQSHKKNPQIVTGNENGTRDTSITKCINMEEIEYSSIKGRPYPKAEMGRTLWSSEELPTTFALPSKCKVRCFSQSFRSSLFTIRERKFEFRRFYHIFRCLLKERENSNFGVFSHYLSAKIQISAVFPLFSFAHSSNCRILALDLISVQISVKISVVSLRSTTMNLRNFCVTGFTLHLKNTWKAHKTASD